MLPSLIDLANTHGVSPEVVQFALDEIAVTSGDPPSYVEAAPPPLPVHYLDLPDMDTTLNPAESQAAFTARLRAYTEEHTRAVEHNQAEQKRVKRALRAYTDYQAYLQAAHRYEQMITTELKNRLPAAAARFYARREAMRQLLEGGVKGKQANSEMLPPPVDCAEDSVELKQTPGNGEGRATSLYDIDEVSDSENDMDVEEGVHSACSEELDDALKELETVVGQVVEGVGNISTRFVAYQDRQVELLERLLADRERRPYIPGKSQGNAGWSGDGPSTH